VRFARSEGKASWTIFPLISHGTPSFPPSPSYDDLLTILRPAFSAGRDYRTDFSFLVRTRNDSCCLLFFPFVRATPISRKFLGRSGNFKLSSQPGSQANVSQLSFFFGLDRTLSALPESLFRFSNSYVPQFFSKRLSVNALFPPAEVELLRSSLLSLYLFQACGLVFPLFTVVLSLRPFVPGPLPFSNFFRNVMSPTYFSVPGVDRFLISLPFSRSH